ncbi:MAG: LamG-like jellyroll fold domain-containing protein [Planctomycetota bacterium]
MQFQHADALARALEVKLTEIARRANNDSEQPIGEPSPSWHSATLRAGTLAGAVVVTGFAVLTGFFAFLPESSGDSEPRAEQITPQSASSTASSALPRLTNTTASPVVVLSGLDAEPNTSWAASIELAHALGEADFRGADPASNGWMRSTTEWLKLAHTPALFTGDATSREMSPAFGLGEQPAVVSLWVKPGDKTQQTIVYRGLVNRGYGHFWSIRCRQDGTLALSCQYRDDTTVGGSPTVDWKSNQPVLPEGQWSHVAVVFPQPGQNVPTCYVNGVRVGVRVHKAFPKQFRWPVGLNEPGPFWLGGNPEWQSWPTFEGQIAGFWTTAQPVDADVIRQAMRATDPRLNQSDQENES